MLHCTPFASSDTQTYQSLTADQLIVGWTNLSAGAIDNELSLAGDSLGIDPSAVHLRMPATLARRLQDELRRLVPQHSSPHPVAGPQLKSEGLTHEVIRVDVVNSVKGEEEGHDHVASFDSSLPDTDATSAEKSSAAQLGPLHAGIRFMLDGSDEALVSAKWLAAALIADANRKVVARVNSSGDWASFVLAIVGAFLPLCVRVAYGLPAMGESPLAIAVLVNTLHSSLWYVFITLLYLKVGIIDYWRRADAMAVLCRLSSRSLAAKMGSAAAAAASAGGIHAAGGLHGLSRLSHASSFRLHSAPGMHSNDVYGGANKATELAPAPAAPAALLSANSFHLGSRSLPSRPFPMMYCSFSPHRRNRKRILDRPLVGGTCNH